MKEKNQGITLIALIITIIVMLILVAVSIQMALNSGLFKQAGKAAHDTEIAKTDEEELSRGDYINEIVEQYIGPKVVEPENIDDWEYTIEEDGTITITCYKGTDTEVVIPNYINGVPVKRVDDDRHEHSHDSLWSSTICSSNHIAYWYTQETITSITVSPGIEIIGAYCFMFSNALTEVYLPKSLTTVRDSAFGSCPNAVFHVPWKEGENQPDGWSEFWHDPGNTLIFAD